MSCGQMTLHRGVNSPTRLGWWGRPCLTAGGRFPPGGLRLPVWLGTATVTGGWDKEQNSKKGGREEGREGEERERDGGKRDATSV